MAAHEKGYGHYVQPSFKSLKSLDLELFSKADLICGRYRSVSSAQFGKNRTPLSVIIFLCTYFPFPCGSKAELKTGVEYDATVANNTTVTIE